MRKKILILLMLSCMPVIGQGQEFGELSGFESNFRTYYKDSTAHAVYLYEKGRNYFQVRRNYVWLITEYHAKIKILDEEGFSEADISIPYYHSEKKTETVSKVKAINHVKGTKHNVMPSAIFDVQVSEHWSEKRFTFSNVQEGSVLEYSYELESPFLYNMKGWEFQGHIPKIYSEYNAKIPGNYKYNRSLLGKLELDVNDATIQSNCFSVPGMSVQADCEVLKYVMKDVPAFKEDEEYMLAPSNYRSRLEFELAEYESFQGRVERFTKSWKDVDREFRTDRDIGGQLRKKNYFERNLPLEIITGKESDLTRAIKLYRFVKAHYNWNGKFGIFRNNNVKKAFEEGVGNVAEINITLINLLNASGIDTDLALISTRMHGLPKKSHPVMSDFNYVVAKTEIDGETYLLDATEKEMPFGMLPYRCLNYYGRVMDLDGDSYWMDIEPEKLNGRTVRVNLELDLMNSSVKGKFDEISKGYDAYLKRKKIAELSQEDYLAAIENEYIDGFFINQYKVDEEQSDEKNWVEHFTFQLEDLEFSKTIYFNPFIIRFFKDNPFRAETRSYPVDFGYQRKFNYMANIEIPVGYTIKELPKPVNLALPDGSGVLQYNTTELNGKIMVVFSLQLRSTQYSNVGYDYLKKLFSSAVANQNQSYIVLEKV